MLFPARFLSVTISLLLVASASAGQTRVHPYLRPDLRTVGALPPSAPAPEARSETSERSRPPSVDVDLLPYYILVALTKALDLSYTRLVIDTGGGKEANAALVGAEQLARAAGLPRHVGRDLASGGLAVGYALVVRRWVYPRSPRAAKVALIAFATLNVGLALLNREHFRVLTAPR